MSKLALMCKKKGKTVLGSDVKKSEITKKLENEDIKIFYKHNANNVSKDLDLVVVSSSISESNVELCQAKKMQLKIVSRGEFLGAIASSFDNVISVAGSHGKTTTTALIGYILQQLNLKPTVHCGGDVVNGVKSEEDDKFFVNEACEYKDNFLYTKNNIAVVLNIEPEHLDYFKTFTKEINSFNKFVSLSDKILCNFNLRQKIKTTKQNKVTQTVSLNCKRANWYSKKISSKNQLNCFEIYHNGTLFCCVESPLLGTHNRFNIICAVAVIELLQITNIKKIQLAICNFLGVKRRMQSIAKTCTTELILDYAHHPTEIKKTLSLLKNESNVLLIFQPHTYSRTKLLMKKFICSFCFFKHDLIIVKEYPAREKFDKEGSAFFLFKNLKQRRNVLYKSKQGVKDFVVKNFKKYKKIIFLGAGDIDSVAKDIKKIICH